MSYKCPICSKFTETTNAMCRHMIGAFNLTEEHQNWITSQGINFPELLGFKAGTIGKGNYKPLMDVIEEKCKVDD